MPELVIGDIKLKSHGLGLVLERLDRPELSFRIDGEGVLSLMDFIGSFSSVDVDRRRAFRVPVFNEEYLHVSLQTSTQHAEVSARDISLTGIYVETRAHQPIDLEVDQQVAVAMEFGSLMETCRGVVKRRNDQGAGIFFSDSLYSEQLDPPVGLLRIVEQLKHRWLARTVMRTIPRPT
jgi:hypothetical protein